VLLALLFHKKNMINHVLSCFTAIHSQ